MDGLLKIAVGLRQIAVINSQKVAGELISMIEFNRVVAA